MSEKCRKSVEKVLYQSVQKKGKKKTGRDRCYTEKTDLQISLLKKCMYLLKFVKCKSPTKRQEKIKQQTKKINNKK